MRGGLVGLDCEGPNGSAVLRLWGQASLGSGASASSQLHGLWQSSLTSSPQFPHRNNRDMSLLGDRGENVGDALGVGAGTQQILSGDKCTRLSRKQPS